MDSGTWFNEDGSSGNRVLIALNADKLLLDSKGGIRGLLATVVHELIHAYFLIRCGERNVDDYGNRQDHNLDFELAVLAINQTLYTQTKFYTTVAPMELTWNGGPGPKLASNPKDIQAVKRTQELVLQIKYGGAH